MKAVSLFSGCGGFDLGASMAGVEVIWANDVFEAAGKFYCTYFPGAEFVRSDIKKINDFPEADLLIGCYPCTGFSEASRRRGKNLAERDLTKNDTNFLFKEFLRAISIVKPKAIFVENVRGMLSANSGQFLNEQIDGFNKLGFINISPLILNAADYGVAQTRQRVFLAGIHKDIANITFVKPARTHGIGLTEYRNLRDVISDLPEWPTGEFFEGKFHGHYLTRNRKRGWDEPSYTIVANADHVPLHPSGPKMENIGKDAWRLGDGMNRRLSWRECSRIQGLPDAEDFDCSLSDKYKVIGNSVPPLLAKSVVEPVISFLKNNI